MGRNLNRVLVPVKLSPLPPYDGSLANQRCTRSHQTTETNDDGFGTTVTEVTVTTTTTRKRYWVE